MPDPPLVRPSRPVEVKLLLPRPLHKAARLLAIGKGLPLRRLIEVVLEEYVMKESV